MYLVIFLYLFEIKHPLSNHSSQIGKHFNNQLIFIWVSYFYFNIPINTRFKEKKSNGGGGDYQICKLVNKSGFNYFKPSIRKKTKTFERFLNLQIRFLPNLSMFL